MHASHSSSDHEHDAVVSGHDSGDAHGAHAHVHAHGGDERALTVALVLIGAFMFVEVAAGIIASSLALISDAAHMLTDAGALAIALVAARLAKRPAHGAMTYGLGRAEILSAQANGMTMVVLACLIVYGAVRQLISPPHVHGGIVLVVAIVGIVVNLAAARRLHGGDSAAQSQHRGLLPPYRHGPVRLHRDRGRGGDDPPDRL